MIHLFPVLRNTLFTLIVFYIVVGAGRPRPVSTSAYLLNPATIPAMDQRQNWVDYGKGIGILLVVYGHLLSSGYHAGLNIPEHFFRLSDSIVYGFHMPFFFLLSGLFIEGSLKKRGVKGYLVDKLLRIAYPYLIWSVIQVSVEVAFASQTQLGATISDLLAVPYIPWGQFWFLYALLVMHITYAIFTLFGRYAKILLFIASLSLFFYPLPTGVMALGGFSVHFIFFVSGMLLKDLFTSLESKNISFWVIGILAVLLVGSSLFIFENRIEPVRLAGSGHPFYFLFLSIFGIMTGILLSQYLARKNIFGFFKILGTYSLQILLVHMLAGVATRVILLQVFGIQNWIIHIVAGVTIALVGPILLYQISTRIRFPYLFDPPKIFTASRVAR